MHPASVANIESERNDNIASAAKSLTGQIVRALENGASRGTSLFLRIPFYQTNVSILLVGKPEEFIRYEFGAIMGRVAQDMKAFGYTKVRAKFISNTEVRIRLFFDREAVFK